MSVPNPAEIKAGVDWVLTRCKGDKQAALSLATQILVQLHAKQREVVEHTERVDVAEEEVVAEDFRPPPPTSPKPVRHVSSSSSSSRAKPAVYIPSVASKMEIMLKQQLNLAEQRCVVHCLPSLQDAKEVSEVDSDDGHDETQEGSTPADHNSPMNYKNDDSYFQCLNHVCNILKTRENETLNNMNLIPITSFKKKNDWGMWQSRIFEFKHDLLYVFPNE